MHRAYPAVAGEPLRLSAFAVQRNTPVSTKYAIVNVFGRQFKVKEGDKIQANYYASDVGAQVSFSDVYMLNNGGSFKVGAPTVAGAKVTATVAAHTRADKVLVFKYLNKNHLKKTQGHRQPYTVLTIDKIEG
jgi:large subunit ribosomal protein L21